MNSPFIKFLSDQLSCPTMTNANANANHGKPFGWKLKGFKCLMGFPYPRNCKQCAKLFIFRSSYSPRSFSYSDRSFSYPVFFFLSFSASFLETSRLVSWFVRRSIHRSLLRSVHWSLLRTIHQSVHRSVHWSLLRSIHRPLPRSIRPSDSTMTTSMMIMTRPRWSTTTSGLLLRGSSYLHVSLICNFFLKDFFHICKSRYFQR